MRRPEMTDVALLFLLAALIGFTVQFLVVVLL